MRTEILAKRTFTAKHFNRGGGLFELEAHVGHIHYRDGALKNGAFEDIDTTLQLDSRSGLYSMQKASYEAEVGLYGDVRFHNVDHSLQFKLPNPNRIQAVPSDDIWGKLGKGLIWRNIIQDGGHQVVLARNGSLAKVFRFDKKPISNVIEFQVVGSPGIQFSDGGPAFDLSKQQSRSIKGSHGLFGSGGRLSFIRIPRAWNHRSQFVDVELRFFRRGKQLWCEKVIPQAFIDRTFSESGAWLETDTTTSFYAGAGDGYTGRSVDPSETFSTIRDGAGTEFNYTITSAEGPGIWDYASVSNKFSKFHRAHIPVDSSGIPDTDIVTGAVFNIVGNYKSNGFGSPDLHLAGSTQANPTVLANADYSRVGRTSFGSISYASFSAAGNNAITLNAAGLAAINKTGFTLLSLQLSWDLNGSFGGTWAAGSSAYFNCDTSEAASGPYLSIIYVSPVNYSLIGSGGVVSGGVAPESATIVQSLIGSGAVIAAGAADWSAIHLLADVTGSGGMISDGAAIASAVITQSAVGAGGAIAGGSSIVSASIIQSVIASGGAVISGEAIWARVFIGLGGAVMGGAAVVSAQITQSFVASGGAVTGGYAITPGMYSAEWKNKGPAFMQDDLLLAQSLDFDKNAAQIVVYRATARVASITADGEAVLSMIEGSEYIDAMGDAEGVEFVRVGNQSNVDRQGGVYIAGDGSGAPFVQVYDGVDDIAKLGTIETIKSHMGRLSGLVDPNFGSLSGYGIYTVHGYYKGHIALGSAISISAGAGLWADEAGNFRVGDPATHKTLTFNVGTGAFTFDSGVELIWSSITGTGKPADNATVGAVWGTNMTPPDRFADAPHAGLSITADYMGYYTGSVWKTYTDSSGHFYLVGSGSHSLSWDGAVLAIAGSITMTGGSISWTNVTAPAYSQITGTKPNTTYIDANGIYTGTLTTSQLNAGAATVLGAVTAGSFNIGSGKFVVTSTGDVTMTSADITGDFATGASGARVILAGGSMTLYSTTTTYGTIGVGDTMDFAVNHPTTGGAMFLYAHISGGKLSTGVFDAASGFIANGNSGLTETIDVTSTPLLVVTGGIITGKA